MSVGTYPAMAGGLVAAFALFACISPLFAVEDLDWKFEGDTNRAPSVVSSVASQTGTIDTHMAPFSLESALSDVRTLPFGLVIFVK